MSYLGFPSSVNLAQHFAANRALKVPVKPSYFKFAKGTPSAHFLKFCKVGTSQTPAKRRPKKHPSANAIMS